MLILDIQYNTLVGRYYRFMVRVAEWETGGKVPYRYFCCAENAAI